MLLTPYNKYKQNSFIAKTKGIYFLNTYLLMTLSFCKPSAKSRAHNLSLEKRKKLNATQLNPHMKSQLTVTQIVVLRLGWNITEKTKYQSTNFMKTPALLTEKLPYLPTWCSYQPIDFLWALDLAFSWIFMCYCELKIQRSGIGTLT